MQSREWRGPSKVALACKLTIEERDAAKAHVEKLNKKRPTWKQLTVSHWLAELVRAEVKTKPPK